MTPTPPPGFQLDSAAPAPPPGFSLDDASEAAPASEQQGNSTLKSIANLSAIPRNGIRALAVGMEHADPAIASTLWGDGKFKDLPAKLQASLAAASDAASPNYVPKDGEKLANFAANAIDPRLLPVFAIAPGASAGLLARAGVGAAQGAVAGSGSAALEDAEKKGKIDPSHVLHAGEGGAAFGGMLAPAAAGASKVADALSDAGDFGVNLFRAMSGVRQGAVTGYLENPEAVKAAIGTPESQKAASDAFRQAVQDRLEAQGQKVRDVREALGIKKDLKMPSLDDLVAEAKQVSSSAIPNPAKSPLPQQPVTNAQGQLLLSAPNVGEPVLGPTDVLHRTDAANTPYVYRQPEPEFKATAPVEKPSQFTMRDPETISRPNGPLSSDIPAPDAPETNLDRVRQIVKLKDQIDGYKKLFSSGQALPNIDSNAASDMLKGLRADLNQQLAAIPEAAPLKAVDSDFHQSAQAYDALRDMMGRTRAATQNRLQNISNPDPMSPQEAQLPELKAAIEQLGGDLPAKYSTAAGEATKRALQQPIPRVQGQPFKLAATAIPRKLLPSVIDLVSALQNHALAPASQIAGAIPQSLSDLLRVGAINNAAKR